MFLWVLKRDNYRYCYVLCCVSQLYVHTDVSSSYICLCLDFFCILFSVGLLFCVCRYFFIFFDFVVLDFVFSVLAKRLAGKNVSDMTCIVSSWT